MRIAIIGAGYVGLVTGTTLSEIGHEVTCIDVDLTRVDMMNRGISPIYEPGLDEMMADNLKAGRLAFTADHKKGLQDAELVFIAVGTPENEDGSADLSYVEQAARDIAENISRDIIVVTKSTVPVGTNDKIKEMIQAGLLPDIRVEIVSNPEFLREGSAIRDSFHADRIVIGSDCEEAADIVEEMNRPFGAPVFKTDIRSAEMIKYASNAFLATKISFINEISNICELLDADVENVAQGMGLDRRIGNQFLKAGIGYGGSCFPKDTKALIQIAGNVDYEFELLKGVVNVNKKQQGLLLDKLANCCPVLSGKKIAVLGLAFKPDTDDMREAASILVTEELVKRGADVIAYDPVATENAKSILHPSVIYADSVEAAIENSDAVLILTEWQEIKSMDPKLFQKMNRPLVIDGRNCFDLTMMKTNNVEYHSIGRPAVIGATDPVSLG